MFAYRPVGLPVCEPGDLDVPRLVQSIEEWVHSAPLADLVERFGGAPPSRELPKALSYLDAFSGSVWDFRRGRERYQSERRDFEPDTEQLIRQAAAALGLSNRERPRGTSYQHLLVLGGRVRTCLARAEYAAGLIRSGVAADQVAGLGSLRPCDPEEAEQATLLGWSCVTEFDAMAAGLRTAFAVTGEATVRRPGGNEPDAGTGWQVASYPRPKLTVHVVAAPSSAPKLRRANTADTLTFWADAVADLTERDRVLLVTSSLHVPFQHCDAIRVLGIRYGCGIDTVGVNGETVSDPDQRVRYRATALLQEIRSAIRSMRQLHISLSAGHTPS